MLTKCVKKLGPTPEKIITLREYVQRTHAVSVDDAREKCADILGVQACCWVRWEEGASTMAIAYWELAVLKLSHNQQIPSHNFLYDRVEKYVNQQRLYEDLNGLIDQRSTRKKGILPTSFTDSLKQHIEKHSADNDNSILPEPAAPLDQDNSFRVLKNAQDANKPPSEIVTAVRAFANKNLGGCGTQNRNLSANAMTVRFKMKKTKASTYAAFAKLDDNDPVLKMILSGRYSSIREAYAATAARLRELRANGNRKAC